MKNISLLFKQFHKIFVLRPLGDSSVIQNYALMHREGLKGYDNLVWEDGQDPSDPQPFGSATGLHRSQM